MTAVTAQEWESTAAKVFLARPATGPDHAEVKAAFPGRLIDEISAGEFALIQSRGADFFDLFMHGNTDWALSVMLDGKVTLLQSRLAAYQLPVPGLSSALVGPALMRAAEIREATQAGKSLDQARQDALNARQDNPPARPTTPTPPAPPPAGPQPPTAQGRQIRYTFGSVGRSEIINLPPGTTGVLFKGTVVVPPLTGDAIRPWIGIRVGDVEGDRENAAMIGIGGREQVRVEAGGVRSKEFQKGFGKVPFRKPTVLEFEWGQQLGPGEVRVVYGRATRTYQTGVTEGAERGGRLTLGVDPGGEYQLLPAGTVLEGSLTILGAGAQPGPGDQSVDPLPPASGNLRAMAEAAFTKVEDARNAIGALLAAIERSGS